MQKNASKAAVSGHNRLRLFILYSCQSRKTELKQREIGAKEAQIAMQNLLTIKNLNNYGKVQTH